ncbi:MAG: DUF1501 domain-containing protein [Bacteroidota bacterium]|jgi:uncharacterized protein (DUF1501 family)
MKRRNFVKNVSLASVAAPFFLKDIRFQAIAKKLFPHSKSAEDRVLVMIRLNGGNDGLNTVIPIDQYDNLVIQRSNLILPETSILPLTMEVGLHPVMGGMQNMFNEGQLSIIQNVGYPQQNRSHFRSMDIWTSGSMDVNEHKGWLGRHFDNVYPNYPMDYPNATYPDPFAISMGYETSTTCQGLLANFSHAVVDPTDPVNLIGGTAIDDGTYYGSHMAYLTTLIAQTNAYGDAINAAADAGNTLSTLYDDQNPIAVQLRYVAQMISGGLKTKVYILNIGGFDTHDSQALGTDTTLGVHASLLKTLSDAVAAFQDDLNLLGLNNRVAGMTFSEFGRQIASNASFGTDHGDAAPMFLFGSCISGNIIGPNPTIGSSIVNQAGVPMQIDFRDVYASILKDWFEVDPVDIQPLFEHTVNYIDVLGACNLNVSELEDEDDSILLYPNPAVSNTTLKVESLNERVKIDIVDKNGRTVLTVCDKTLDQGEHHIPIDLKDIGSGRYVVHVYKASGIKSKNLVKVK